jgi:hypothetical protein
MTTVLLNTSGSGTWTVPSGLAANSTVTIEGWGAAGGGGARSSGSAFGSGGGGGAYTSSTYTLTTNDITNGVPYVVGAGGAGGTGGDGVSGGNSTWSNNNLNILTNSLQQGASVGVLPTNWTSTGTPTGTIVNVGVDATTGLPFVDVQWSGTTSSTHADFSFDGLLVCSASTAYNVSVYLALVGGSTTNITSVQVITDDWTSASGFLAAIITDTVTLTGTLAQTSGHATTASSGLKISSGLQLNWTAGKAINLTIRVAGAQIEAGTSASAWKSTPGYMSAPAGSRSNGASGGAGGVAGIGTGTKNTGGAGAAYASTGAGGGGSAGPDGNGNASSTGAGGQGDATTGGAGGSVSATSPGNAGTSATSGGGGGGSLITVGAPGDVAGAGGAPGGGGGGAVFYSGLGPSTGGAGAIGQIRITYSSGVVNQLALAASNAASSGLIKQVEFPIGSTSTEAFSISRTLATSYRAQAASTQSAARVLAIFKSASVASSQVGSFARNLLLVRTHGAASAQSASYSRLLSLVRSYSAASAESASIVARRAKLQTVSTSSPETISLHKVPSKGLNAVDAQSFGVKRAMTAVRTAVNIQSTGMLRGISKTLGRGSQQASGIAKMLSRNIAASATDPQAPRLQRSIGHQVHTASTQSLQVIRNMFRAFGASGSQSGRLARQSARSFGAASPESTRFSRSVGIVAGYAQGSFPQIIIASGGVVLGWAQGQVINAVRNRQKAPFVVLSSTVTRITTWFHTYIPLSQRTRVVRLPPPGDISTLPPMIRRIVLPREEDGVFDNQIYRAEPEFFSPFDPSDQQTFTFDWSVRGYANDAIVWAEITGIAETPGLPDLNFIGPTFIDSFVVPGSMPSTLGYLVSITVGEFTPLYIPVMYTLRCSVTFASGRVGNWSIPFQVKTL